jgi:hypothetical protein
MVLETPFTCGNGHSFIANAKLRAKCPDCGVLARRKFVVETPTTTTTETVKSESPIETIKKPLRQLKLIRKGQGRTMPARAKTKPAPATKVQAKIKTPMKAGRAAHGLIKTSSVHRGVTPTIKKPPKKMAVARVTQVNRASPRGVGSSYQDQIKAKYFPW